MKIYEIETLSGSDPRLAAIYTGPTIAVVTNTERYGERGGEANALAAKLTGGAGVVLFGPRDGHRTALINPERDLEEGSFRLAASHLLDTARATDSQVTTIRALARAIGVATYLYTVDTYSPDGTIEGPSGMPRGEALEYLTERMRGLAGGPSEPPPEGWSEWGPYAVSVLDQADETPTVGQRATVSLAGQADLGVIVTAESLPEPDLGRTR